MAQVWHSALPAAGSLHERRGERRWCPSDACASNGLGKTLAIFCMSAVDGGAAVTPHGSNQDIAIDVATPDQLFNAPPINPFSERDVELLGEAGLSFIVRQLQVHRRDWQHMRLVLRLPPDQIMAASDPPLVEALRRQCKARIADNALEIRLIRQRSSVGLGILAAIVVAAIMCAYVLFTTVLSGASQVVLFIVAGAISLFSWVTLWDVLEALIFNPIPLLRENATLRKLAALDIVVEPDHSKSDTRNAGQPSDETMPQYP